MRKREFQSFTLKLSDLHEYEVVREERLKKITDTGAKSNDSSSSFLQTAVKYGPKTKQEIRARLGIKD